MNPPVIGGMALGASISVVDSTALSALDPNGLTIGTAVNDLGTPATWILTISTAGLSSTVKAVKGITGWRWVKYVAPSGTVSSVVAGSGITVDATDPTAPIVTNPFPVSIGAAPTPLAAGATDMTLMTGIDGDAATAWRIWGQVVVGATNNISLRPNNGTSNLTSNLLIQAVSLSISNGRTDWAIGDDTLADVRANFNITIYSKVGQQRLVVVHCWHATATYYMQGTWTDTATKLTSLVLHSDVTNGLLSGSWCKYQATGATV